MAQKTMNRFNSSGLYRNQKRVKSLRPNHILIVEDSEDLQNLLGQIFESEGFTVEHAYHGRQALDLLQAAKQSPSLILLDVMMPVMDGFEFRKLQTHDPEISAIPVVVMTADPHVQPAQLGVERILRKPITDIGELVRLAASHNS